MTKDDKFDWIFVISGFFLLKKEVNLVKIFIGGL